VSVEMGPNHPLEGTPSIRDYLQVLGRRKWIVLAFLFVTVNSAVVFTYTRTPVYEAEAQVLVQPFSLEAEVDSNPDNLSLETEALIATSPQIAQLAAQELREDDPGSLLNNLEVSVAPDASVLEYEYANKSPREAVRRVEALAQAYVANRTQESQDRLDAISSSIQSQIDELQQQLDNVQSDIAAAPDQQTRAALTEDADTLSQQIAFERTRLFSLADPTTLDVGRVLYVSEIPTTPSSPKRVTNILIALLVGIAGGVGLAFLRDRLDERLSGRSDLETASGAPVLALVPHVANWTKPKNPYLVTDLEPQSTASEAYRTLRTAVLFAASQSDIKILMIASANEIEGKTVTTSNLAVVLGQAGKRVVVVSGDLRKPRLHHFFQVSPPRGVTNVLAGEARVAEVLHPIGPYPQNVSLLSSGPIPGNPAELLGSEAMMSLLKELRETHDFVIIDSAPVLAVTDAMIVARSCDGVILVADATKTKRGPVQEARVQLEQVEAKIIGSVLHNTDPSKAYTYAAPATPSSVRYELDESPSRLGLRRQPWSRQKS